MPEHPASLVVESVPEGAVRLDGEEVGMGHVERELAAGTYALDVTAPGREPFHRTVTLGAGERVVVDARGASSGTPIEQEPLFWVGIVGGAAVIAGIVVLAVVLSQPSDPLAGYEGSTGVVLMPLTSF